MLKDGVCLPDSQTIESESLHGACSFLRGENDTVVTLLGLVITLHYFQESFPLGTEA